MDPARFEELSKTHKSHHLQLNWWKDMAVYQISLPTFRDSNGDGFGDFRGVSQSLRYIKSLGFDTIMLSPFFSSPKYDLGYDVINHYCIDHMYGSSRDLYNLMQVVKKKDMNIIIELPINQTSAEHRWFFHSIEGTLPFENYYIWGQSNELSGDYCQAPNNWLSVHGRSAWTLSHLKYVHTHYLHRFLKDQPDLNLRLPDVMLEIKNIIMFWAEKGVDGFYFPMASHLTVSRDGKDEPLAKGYEGPMDRYESLEHIYTKNSDGYNFSIFSRFFQRMHRWYYPCKKKRVMIGKLDEDTEKMMRYYGKNDGEEILDMPLNSEMININRSTTAKQLHELIAHHVALHPVSQVATWMIGSHDYSRFASRARDFTVGFHVILMLLPGVVFYYYGDEIGMTNSMLDPEDMEDLSYFQHEDNFSRDPFRTPMQWTGKPYAGFTQTDVKPYLPVDPSYTFNNVKMQRQDPASLLFLIPRLLKLKKALINPILNLHTVAIRDVFVMTRHTRKTAIVVLFNMGEKSEHVNLLTEAKLDHLREYARVEITNNPLLREKNKTTDEYWKESTAFRRRGIWKWQFRLSDVFLLPSEAMVLLCERYYEKPVAWLDNLCIVDGQVLRKDRLKKPPFFGRDYATGDT